jgi:hypothetical protein
MRDGEEPTDDDILALPRFAYLKNKTPQELRALEQLTQNALKRYDEALHMGLTVLGEREQQG